MTTPPATLRRRTFTLGAALATPLLATLLSACGRTEAPAAPTASAPTPAAAPAARIYTVGTDAVYAPFEFQNERGEIQGFDIDLVKAVAQRAGIEVKFVNTPWEGMFNTLAQGDRDILVSAITITPERAQTMDFSAPYFDARQLIAVPAASKVQRFADLKPLRVAVQTGTTGDEVVSQLLGKTNPRLKRFESTPLALQELDAGGVDAVVADNGVIAHYVAHHPGARFKSVEDPSFIPEQYGLVVKKGNAALLAQLNDGLVKLLADGGYAEIHTRWFGAAPTALPGSVPTAAATAPSSTTAASANP
ncbi:basic amino acid ABC transporter substrate-binding protein [Ideonella livida]|uniref:Basic amino acid ABC transporter substrate-binding protein n=1 Tax=Ideonella livida TaxID=2707176 RepID=A0A7C9PJB3_9BURK|nr:basic amino acid ABC transporter substrate-binding protein [Ideonella livida]NDY93308.1 basic amino acid ABC transporter substrate-binding protein [Ideonella livida]